MNRRSNVRMQTPGSVIFFHSGPAAKEPFNQVFWQSKRKLLFSLVSKGHLPDPHFKSGAFTLLELLIVIGVISLLAGLLLPVLARGKMSAKRITCANNLRQLSLATHMYWDDNNG